VIGKLGITAQGSNPLFIVTNIVVINNSYTTSFIAPEGIWKTAP
jgi:hypothetical protein